MENLSVSTEELSLAASKISAQAVEIKAGGALDVVEHVVALAPAVGIIGAEYLAKIAQIESRYIDNINNIADGYQEVSDSLHSTVAAYKDADETLGNNLAN